MLRTLFTAAVFSAFGAVAIAPIRERVQDQLWQPVEACSVGLVSLAAVLHVALFLLIIGRRRAGAGTRLADSPSTISLDGLTFVGGYQPVSCLQARPNPPKVGSGVKPPNCICYYDGVERVAR